MLKTICRQAGRTLIAAAGSYGLALLVTLLAFAPSDEERGALYNVHAYKTVFRTEPKYFLLHREPLARDDASILLVGASNVAVGFDLKYLAPLFPGRSVHNLGLGGANMTEVAQVVDLVREIIPDARLANETFVFGLWYGLFIDDATRWRGGPTDIDIERLRYGLYRRVGGKFEPVLPVSLLPYAALVLRPLLVADLAIKGSLQPVRHWLEKGEPMQRDLNTVMMDDAAKRRKLEEWREEVGMPNGQLRDEQFEVLVSTVRALAARGARVVLIDLPLPRWHRDGSPYLAYYRERLGASFARLADLPNVSYHDLLERFPDSEFYDEVHPRPRVRRQWAIALAATTDPDIPPAPAISMDEFERRAELRSTHGQ